ncbi:hypothetical protein AMBLS11_12310 [Alteromonas macleodii str. 'Black Sea 11']|nr:hypothetical protein AMBLS11_12310 [Alteromonas macleodii str. 'Black Sea 11']
MALNLRVLFKGDATPLKKESKKATSAISSVVRSAAGLAAGAGVTLGTAALAGQLIDVTKRYQNLEAQLRTSTGSIQNQQKAFAALKRFAADTGQDVGEVTTAFTRLVNLGLDPSKEALTSYASIAAASGKTTMDFVEAVADASTAEFERLKEFGIRAKNEGDTVKFTFQGVTTEVKNTATDIENYLQNLGNEKFGDALANQAQTLEASINRAGMAWDEFFYAISEAGVGDVIQEGFELAASALNDLTAMIASGELQASITAWINQFDYAYTAIADGITFVREYFGAEFDAISDSSDDAVQNIIDAFKYLPTNIKSFVQILTVEIASIVDVAYEYGAAFAKIIAAKFNELVQKAKAFGSEMKDAARFWDGDTFDYDAAIAAAEKTADGMVDKYVAAAQKQVEVSRQARLSAITDIMDERKARIDSYDQEIDKAEELRQKWNQAKQDRENTDLGQFRIDNNQGDGTEGGQNNGQPTEEQTAYFDKLRERYATEEELLRIHYKRELAQIQEAENQKKVTEDQARQLREKAEQDYYTKLARLQNQRTNMILSSSQQIFSGLTSLVGQFGGKQTKAYKAMFAVTKGFSIAQGVLNLSTAISNASALPFPANVPAMASAAAQGAKLIADIKGANYQGQAHDGIGRVPAANEGTWMLKRGEMVLNNRQRDNFEYLVDYAKRNQQGQNAGSGGVVIQNKIEIDARGAAAGTEEQIATAMDAATERMKQEIAEDFANGGPLYRQVNNRGMAA